MDKAQRLKRMSLKRKVDYVNKYNIQEKSIWDLDPDIIQLAEWADL